MRLVVLSVCPSFCVHDDWAGMVAPSCENFYIVKVCTLTSLLVSNKVRRPLTTKTEDHIPISVLLDGLLDSLGN